MRNASVGKMELPAVSNTELINAHCIKFSVLAQFVVSRENYTDSD